MPSPNESGGEREPRRHESGAANSPAGEPGDARDPRHEKPWGLAFVLFLLGFVALIVLSKVHLSGGTTNVLRVLAAGLCVSAFLIARTQRKRR